jgi:hypothetical protein
MKVVAAPANWNTATLQVAATEHLQLNQKRV